jgi:choice-of-anchor A domain-containing protein
VCSYAPNLGDEFSGPTGDDHYVGKWPNPQGVPAFGMAYGRDDSVAFFVGRNYYGKSGAEIEGKIVIMGNLVNDGINSMVQVGIGSQVIPNNGQDVITVGKNFETKTNIAIMQNSAFVSGNIVYKGSLIKNKRNIWTNGQVTEKRNLDLSGYEKALDELKVKSAYWAKLPMNGVYTPYNESPAGNAALFKAGNDDCVQVFNLSQDEFSDLRWGIHVKFDANLQDRTVLINFGSDSNKNVKIKNLANFFDPFGKGHMDFDSGFTASILWNFYDANYVDLGGGSHGVGEFQGSVLVPNGSLMMQFPGQSGRTIVGLDLTQNRGGSEFHSYPFNPPKCNLPLPPCAMPDNVFQRSSSTAGKIGSSEPSKTTTNAAPSITEEGKVRRRIKRGSDIPDYTFQSSSSLSVAAALTVDDSSSTSMVHLSWMTTTFRILALFALLTL